MMSLLWASVVLCMVAVANAAIDADLVKDLPGLSWTPTFKQYSGYLKAADKKHLHYWLIEAESDPKTAPLVVWMNGGPGCSSLDGLLTEHGPFIADDNGKDLKQNSYSWNKIANMLYLEAPAGVGFSYADDGNYTTTDDQTAKENHMALRDFLQHYPEFANNEFFITGESYGGIYVPTLAALIVDDKDFNFKGFAVGNGLSDSAMNDNSLIYFGYYHGLFGTSVWDSLVKYCCKNGCSTLGNCNFANNKDKNCQNAVMQANQPIQELNMYNMYAECYQGPDANANVTVAHPHDRFLFKNNIYIQRQLAAQNSRNLKIVPPCVNVLGTTVYLNTPAVRKAIHVSDRVPKWEICSAIDYNRQYDSMRAQYLKVLATKKQRILVYNGDVDMACNYLGDEWFTDSLGQQLKTPRAAWHYKDVLGNPQVAGYVKSFLNLDFITIKGAGHMVPQNKPEQSLEFFTNFIQNKPYH